jgi:hypothetical protein
MGDDKKVNTPLKLESNFPAFKDVWAIMTPSLREFVGLTIPKYQAQFQVIDENIKKAYR